MEARLRPGEVWIQGLGKRYWFKSAGAPDEEGLAVDDEGDDEAGGKVLSVFGPRTEVWALRNITCHIEPSERLAILGSNGAGKSTLVSILSRLLPPSEGSVTGAGKVVPFNALRRVLTPELSACQNVKLIGQLLGLPNDLLDERLPKMVAFSELGQLAYEKASRLSPGSFCRLAMALPLFVDPDICLIDDDIRISDQAFRAKFQRKFNEILAGPATMIFASNNLASLRSYCRRALWLERGQLVADGEISTVIERFVSQQKSDGADLNRPQLMPNIDPKVVSGISSWIRRRLVTSADPKEVRSEVEAYASVARERSKLNRELTEIELITAMTNKPSPPPKTVQSELMRVDRTLAELIAGTSGIQDRHENILKAHAQIRERLVELCADSPPSNMENAGSNDQFHSKNVVAAVRRVTRSRAH